PGTGRLQALPVRTALSAPVGTPARAYQDGKAAVVQGEPIGQAASALALYTIDLSSGSMKRLSPHGLNVADVSAFVVAPDGKAVLAAVKSGALTRVTSLSARGAATERPLFTVSSTIWYMDIGP